MCRQAWLCSAALSLSCFNGDAATGLPCDDDAQCAVGQRCIDNVCGGPSGTSDATESFPTSLTEPSSTSPTADTTGTSAATQTDGSETGSGSESSGGTGADGPCAGPYRPVCKGSPLSPPIFTPKTIGDDGQNAVAVVAEQFFGDATVDLAVLNFGSADMTAHTWNADQLEFEMRPEILFGFTDAVDIDAGDLDCDGDADLAAVGPMDGTIHVVWGDTAQPLTEQTDEMFGADGYFSLAIADFVEDVNDQVEIAAAGNVLRLVQWPGTGPDELDFRSTDAIEPWGSFAADFDGDGRAEMVIASGDRKNAAAGTDDVYIFPIAGTSIVAPIVLPGFENPYGFAALDVDDDGDLDLAVIEKRIDMPPEQSGQEGYLTLCINAGKLSFECGEPMIGPVGTNAVVAGDFDCDGRDDIVVAGAVTVDLFLRAKGPGNFERTPDLASLTSSGARMAVADFDDNGYLDIAIPDFGVVEPTPSTSRVVVLMTALE